jgi:hypothetical protein
MLYQGMKYKIQARTRLMATNCKKFLMPYNIRSRGVPVEKTPKATDTKKAKPIR